MQYTTTTRHSWATCELAQHRGTCQHRGDISVQPVWLVSQKESYFQCLCSQSWRFQLKFPSNASLCLWPLSVSPHCQFPSTWALVGVPARPLVLHWYIATRTKITKGESSLAKICTWVVSWVLEDPIAPVPGSSTRSRGTFCSETQITWRQKRKTM